MSDASARWDVVILGTGIGGSTLGAILSRNGLRVLLLEKAGHPRFAIGESTVPETTFNFRILAARYGVPEIGMLSTFQAARRNVGTSCGVKRAFTFITQRAGAEPGADQCDQYCTLSPPLGPDLHMFRQDVDAWMMHVAMRYGATVQQGVEVVGARFEPDGVYLRTADGRDLESDYVVDAGGIQALLPRLLGLREEPCPLRTRSRVVYTHMVGVLPYDRCHAPQEQHGLTMPLSQSTLHHLFPGAWMWVIPFDNHPGSTNPLCSVGLVMDVDRHPSDGRSGEREFRDFIAPYPALRRQFDGAVAARPWVSSGRVQFSSKTMVGDRFCLLPHAAAFVDPFFSSGLGITMGAINGMAWRLIAAKKDGDWSGARFAPVDHWTRSNIDYFDRLVRGSYIAFGDFDLWNAWYKLWMTGTMFGSCGALELIGRYQRSGDPSVFDACEQQPFRGIQATDLPPYAELFGSAFAVMEAVQRGETSSADAQAQIYRLLGESGLWPATFGPPSRDVRTSGSFLLARLPALRSWMLANERTKPWCTYLENFTSLGVMRMALDDLHQEWKSPTGDVGILMRDLVSAWNQDWV